MLKIDKTGVSTSKRVYFRMFLPSLASVMAARPCFLLILALCCRSTCQFRGNSEKSNHMLSATSHIGLEFLTKFLNMSKLQNRLILLYQSLPLHLDQSEATCRLSESRSTFLHIYTITNLLHFLAL